MNIYKLPFKRRPLFAIFFCAISFLLFATISSAADKKGSKDHPMISRYAGSKIMKYSEKSYDDYKLFIKKAGKSGGKDKNPESTKTLEGKVTKITYQAPPERSTLEVFRNYTNSLTNNGFKDIYACENKACGGRNFNHAVAPYGFFGEDYEDQRFLAAKLERTEGNIFVSLYVALHNDGSKENNNRVRVQLDIIEMKPMDTNMVVVDASAIEKGLNAEGHIAIYSIFFDTDSAKLKQSSKPALDEIAKLLTQKPELNILIVGHTDNVGGLDYNKKLSKQRATSVLNTLVNQYKIKKGRLYADGVAYLAPVASNRSEPGRAKNRRVELVDAN